MPAPIHAEEHARRSELYAQGLSDTAISRQVGVGVNAIKSWRDKNRLPPNFEPKAVQPLTRDNEARRHLIYQLGYTDLGMAREFGVNRTNVKRWRLRRGLPINNPTTKNQRHCKVSTLANVFARVRRAVGKALPRDIADDAVSDMCRDILDGTIPLAEIEAQARRYGNRVLDRFASRYGPRSLDENIGDDDGFRMIDMVRDERSSSWLEEMGATVW